MKHQWIENVCIAGRDLFTVFPDGTLEIRGPGWDHKRRKGDTDMTDRPRICKLGTEERARKIVELIIAMSSEKEF